MKVTLNTQNRNIQKQKKNSFAAHIKGLKLKEKNKTCISNKLKIQFDSFISSQDLKEPTFKQTGYVKNFQVFTKKYKQINTQKKAFNQISFHPKKQSIQSQAYKEISIYNNPQTIDDQIQKSLNELKNPKLNKSNHSTKANSKEKSRATSVDSSNVCCNLIKTQKQQVIVRQQKKQGSFSKNTTKEKEKQKKINKITSPQITKITRIIMLDWLFQLSAEIQLPKQALYNSIDYIDKYVRQCEVKKTQYQQVGLACLFLATKLQMSSHPQIQIFLEAMDNQLNKQVLIQTEKKVVKTLKFRLNPPTLYQYITVAILTIKTFKSQYKNISWVNDLPSVEKGTQAYRKLDWIMDGVTMEGVLTHKYGKDDICLSILYTAMCSQISCEATSMIRSKQKQIQQTRNDSTAYSQFSLSSLQRPVSILQEEEQKFKVSFQCFLRYATTSSKSLQSLQKCIEDLEKWKSSVCDCYNIKTEYHEELKELAMTK